MKEALSYSETPAVVPGIEPGIYEIKILDTKKRHAWAK
jgi:hypothetical protein